jgi:ABC-type Fe3+ transport system permease subunit
LRFLAALLILLYVAALYLEWNFDLSVESRQYQADFPDAIRSGFSLAYFIAKVVWGIGTLLVLCGVLKALWLAKGAFPYLACSAPLLAIATVLLAPQSNYPSVEPTMVHLLWCAFSATWAALLALSWRSSNHSIQPTPEGAADR